MTTAEATQPATKLETQDPPHNHRRLLSSAAPLALFVAFLLARTALSGAALPEVDAAPQLQVPDEAALRLAGAVRIQTISPEDTAQSDAAAFQELHEYLRAQFPAVHAELRREVVNSHSLLYTWQGSDPSLAPILLMGHLDVVPVEPGSESHWEHEPFGGRIVDGFIWGRGAIDNKSAVLGTLEAVELLISTGFRPARTVYLAYGHDEEVGGTQGAQQIAALLRSRGVKLDMVLDEGGVIADGLLPGVSAPVALVGVAEKGFLSLELSTQTAGGHSSLPPRQSAVGILSAAITRVEANPVPARLSVPTRKLFEHIAAAAALPQRVVLSNLWLTEGLLLRKLEQSAATNAMVRTTTAATLFQAGTKDNVLPSHARAIINFRILPGDSAASVEAHVRETIGDERVTLRRVGRFFAEPAAASSTESESFRTLTQVIRDLNPDVVVAPYLVVVVTDARYFQDLSANVFRFLPMRLTPDDLERMHGANERISVHAYEHLVRTYHELIVRTASRRGSPD